MKNKALKIFICLLAAFLLLSSINAYAWMPDRCFSIDIEEQHIPDGTIYVDFLMPISKDDEAYVSFNEKNGELFGILSDSEIVNYCEDGFVSYTFHIVDADSNMQPYYIADFNITDEVFERHKALFDGLDLQSGAIDDRYVTVRLGSDTEEKLENIEAVTQIEINYYHDATLYTQYNSDYNRDSKFNYEYCKEKYKYAKIAYLDRNGNILGVSNKVKINPKRLGGVQLNLRLSGESLTTDVTTGPPVYILFIAVILIFILIVLAVIISVILILHKTIKSRKENKL